MNMYDVSEIKAFRECQRKWKFTSRNAYHLRAKKPSENLLIGTVFHNCLHKLYVGKPLEEVENYLVTEMREASDTGRTTTLSMVRNYAKEVIPEDLNSFKVLDIEYRFEFTPFEAAATIAALMGIESDLVVENFPDVVITGSIDMVMQNIKTEEIWGVEHKSAKSFRDEAYSWMDEQPRLYAVAMLLRAVKNNQNYGGMYLNEVRKLIRAFDYKRTPLIYPLEDLYNFLLSFFGTVAECHKKVLVGDAATILPKPSYMQCSMCDFRKTCKEIMYSNISLGGMLSKYGEDFAVRQQDHLDEKAEE